MVDRERGAVGDRREALVEHALLAELRQRGRAIDGARLTTTSRSALSWRARCTAMLSAVTSQFDSASACAPNPIHRQPDGGVAAVQHAPDLRFVARQLQLRVQPTRHVRVLRPRQHRHVVRRHVVELPQRLRLPHLIGKAPTAADDGDAPSAELCQQRQPLSQQWVAGEAAAEFDDPHVNRLADSAARPRRRSVRRPAPSPRCCGDTQRDVIGVAQPSARTQFTGEKVTAAGADQRRVVGEAMQTPDALDFAAQRIQLMTPPFVREGQPLVGRAVTRVEADQTRQALLRGGDRPWPRHRRVAAWSCAASSSPVSR